MMVSGLILLAVLQGSATPASFNDMFGAWSPDGQRIAFTSDRSGDPEIYVADADGTDLLQLTHSPGRDAHPSWSADGKYLLFQSPREGGHTRIFRMAADGSDQRSLAATEGFCGVPSWSPDGSAVAFQCSPNAERAGEADAPWRLYLLDRQGAAPLAITTGPGNDQVPSWSPDGRKLLFYSDRSGTDQLYEITLAGGAIRQLTLGPARHKAATYSRDGKRFALMRAEPEGKADVYVMTTRGTLRRLTNSGPEFGAPMFSRDSKRLLVQMPTTKGWRLFIIPTDGRSPPRPIEFRP